MLAFFHRLLLRLPPETAHHLAMAGLRLWQWLCFRLLRRRLPPAPAPFAVHVTPSRSLTFRGRVGLAAGFDKNAEAFAGFARLGFGFIEVGTVTPLPQPGNPKPRLFRVGPNTLINHMGFNSCGIERFRANLVRYREAVRELPLFANVGKNRATPEDKAVVDYAAGMQALAGLVDGFVVNLSSPNTPGLVKLQSTAFLEALARHIPADSPVWVKFSPDLADAELGELCAFVSSHSRYHGVVVTNTSRRLAESLYHAEQGGVSGAPLTQRSLECLHIAREKVKAPKLVVGVGGIVGGDEARRFLDAGADLIEVYTGFVYGGPAWLARLNGEIRG